MKIARLLPLQWKIKNAKCNLLFKTPYSFKVYSTLRKNIVLRIVYFFSFIQFTACDCPLFASNKSSRRRIFKNRFISYFEMYVFKFTIFFFYRSSSFSGLYTSYPYSLGPRWHDISIKLFFSRTIYLSKPPKEQKQKKEKKVNKSKKGKKNQGKDRNQDRDQGRQRLVFIFFYSTSKYHSFRSYNILRTKYFVLATQWTPQLLNINTFWVSASFVLHTEPLFLQYIMFYA